MGIFFDYFHAPDEAAATARVKKGFFDQRGEDFVSMKFVDPTIKLASALTLLKGGEAPYVITTTHVWPPEANKPRTREAMRNLPPDSPWANVTYMIEAFAPDTRDDLAAIDASAVQSLMRSTTLPEEWAADGFTPKDMAERIRDVARIAARAKAVGEPLFVHTSGF